jgi:hypothetical protein
VTGDAERTNDRRQTCTKLGPEVLGTQMETHNSVIASFLYYSLLSLCFFFSLLFKASLLYNSLKPCFHWEALDRPELPPDPPHLTLSQNLRTELYFYGEAGGSASPPPTASCYCLTLL